MTSPLTQATIAALEAQRAKIDTAIAALRALEEPGEPAAPVKRRRGRPPKIHAVEAMRAGAGA